MRPAIRPRPSPNHDSRNGRAIDMIVLHYTGMIGAAESLERLCDPAAKVSAHYLIDEDGMVYSLVPEERRAWHAGVAFWSGERDINTISVGIELQNPGHEHGYRAFPDVQIEALISLLDGIRSRHAVPDARIVGHSDVAPARKEDPGELFPWARLAAAGHGLWPEMEAAAIPVEDAAAALARLGYACSGSEGGELEAALMAFQRHFLPGHLTAKADLPTLRRLGQFY